MQNHLICIFIIIITTTIAWSNAAVVHQRTGVKAFYHTDVEILLNCTSFKCDNILCPPETYRCHVTKEKISLVNLERTNICYSKDDEILLRKVTTEPINPIYGASLKVDIYAISDVAEFDTNPDEVAETSVAEDGVKKFNINWKSLGTTRV